MDTQSNGQWVAHHFRNHEPRWRFFHLRNILVNHVDISIYLRATHCAADFLLYEQLSFCNANWQPGRVVLSIDCCDC